MTRSDTLVENGPSNFGFSPVVLGFETNVSICLGSNG